MRYKNINSGALVDVRDDKIMDSSWESLDGEAPVQSGPDYGSMSAADLQAELDRRNADRDDDGQIVVEGTGANGNVLKGDIAKALEADDAAGASSSE